jgi:hypothetical protein
MLSGHSGILLLTPVERKNIFFSLLFFSEHLLKNIGTPWHRAFRDAPARVRRVRNLPRDASCSAATNIAAAL